jgi:hypothetical protein
MGRKKIAIEKIEDPRLRVVSIPYLFQSKNSFFSPLYIEEITYRKEILFYFKYINLTFCSPNGSGSDEEFYY